MKKVSFITLLAVLAVTGKLAAQSESYTPWQIDWTLGGAIPGGEGTKGGISAYFEPKFHINDNISAGIRAGFAAIGKVGVFDANGKPVGEFSTALIVSYLATSNYYFQFSEGGKFRPFVGIGLGYAVAKGFSLSKDLSIGDATGF